MRVLIVEAETDLADLWAAHLVRLGHATETARDADAAIRAMQRGRPEVLVIDLDLENAAAWAVADYAAYRHPKAKQVFVTASRFFSGGSVFDMSANACALLPLRTRPEDLAAVVEFHGERRGGVG